MKKAAGSNQKVSRLRGQSRHESVRIDASRPEGGKAEVSRSTRPEIKGCDVFPGQYGAGVYAYYEYVYDAAEQNTGRSSSDDPPGD